MVDPTKSVVKVSRKPELLLDDPPEIPEKPAGSRKMISQFTREEREVLTEAMSNLLAEGLTWDAVGESMNLDPTLLLKIYNKTRRSSLRKQSKVDGKDSGLSRDELLEQRLYRKPGLTRGVNV